MTEGKVQNEHTVAEDFASRMKTASAISFDKSAIELTYSSSSAMSDLKSIVTKTQKAVSDLKNLSQKDAAAIQNISEKWVETDQQLSGEK